MIPFERSAAFEWGFEKGEQAERERIIKLLELNVAYSVAVCDGGNKNILEIEELIALIKGENK